MLVQRLVRVMVAQWVGPEGRELMLVRTTEVGGQGPAPAGRGQRRRAEVYSGPRNLDTRRGVFKVAWQPARAIRQPSRHK